MPARAPDDSAEPRGDPPSDGVDLYNDFEYEEDPSYVPTQEDVDQYATFLGIDLVSERHLLWIAQKGVMARLPENWRAMATADGKLYYFNLKTEQSVWEHPRDKEFRQLLQQLRAEQAAAAPPPSSPGEVCQAEAAAAAPAPASPARSAVSSPPHPAAATGGTSSPPREGACPSAAGSAAEGGCARLQVLPAGASGGTPMLSLRVGTATCFAAVCDALHQRLGSSGRWEVVDEEGFVFPPSDTVRSHFAERRAICFARLCPAPRS
eukprot:TRINITY_DN3912_c3_g1_i1.p1 TRINITY_DN3912_c3_g1~~TRINITY_DN3912_c3_g1_i1.p1  ORF type:complete len:265 (+),score=36.48 TRINITY_DN3912_c3_g1_i1:87-881(+)